MESIEGGVMKRYNQVVEQSKAQLAALGKIESRTQFGGMR